MPPGRAFKWHFLRVAGVYLWLTLSIQEEASPGLRSKPLDAWERGPSGRGVGEQMPLEPQTHSQCWAGALSQGCATQTPGAVPTGIQGHSTLGTFLFRDPSLHGAGCPQILSGDASPPRTEREDSGPGCPAYLAVPEGWAVPGLGDCARALGSVASCILIWGKAKGSDWEPGRQGCEVVAGEGGWARAFFFFFHFKRIHIFPPPPSPMPMLILHDRCSPAPLLPSR